MSVQDSPSDSPSLSKYADQPSGNPHGASGGTTTSSSQQARGAQKDGRRSSHDAAPSTFFHGPPSPGFANKDDDDNADGLPQANRRSRSLDHIADSQQQQPPPSELDGSAGGKNRRLSIRNLIGMFNKPSPGPEAGERPPVPKPPRRGLSGSGSGLSSSTGGQQEAAPVAEKQPTEPAVVLRQSSSLQVGWEGGREGTVSRMVKHSADSSSSP